MLMLLAILLPMAAGALLPLWRPGASRARRGYVMASSCAAAALGLTAALTLPGEEAVVVLALSDRLSVAFQADGLSCLFAVMVSLLWPVASLYALEYMSQEGGEDRFFAFYLIAFGVTLGVAFSANILTMYFFYELLTLATLPLVMHGMDGKARYAGRVYLIYSM